MRKDVLAQRVLKVAGAEIDTDPATTSDGLALVGYPVAKRLALSVQLSVLKSLPSLLICCVAPGSLASFTAGASCLC